MDILFQEIAPEDVHQLRSIALKTFIQSYKHLNTEKNFDWYTSQAFCIEKLLEEIRCEDSFLYFIRNEKNIVGYLKLNINDSQTENHCLDCLEIERIYLSTEFQSKGIGRKMVQFAINKAIALSRTKIWLGVWINNPGAIEFYKKMGFIESGSHIFKFGDEDQIDILMEKSIN